MCTLLNYRTVGLETFSKLANVKVPGVSCRPAKSEIDVSVVNAGRYLRIELKFHTPAVVNRTFGNRTQLNADRSIDFDWVR